MKRQLILAGASLMGLAAMAETLTPEQALTRALDGAPAAVRAISNVQPTLVFTKYTYAAQPAAYVFARPEAGYMVLAADDVAVPVLGYSDGVFDPANENLQYWLGEYAREIANAKDAGAQPATSAALAPSNWAKIAPLCKTTWDQGNPYNLLCPMQGNARSVTGCVATAMAQVMKYHNWPVQGSGSVSYQTSEYRLNVSCDISSYTFDWGNMLNSYAMSSNEAQRKAVAELMFCCGASVKMDYSSFMSGAQSAEAAVAMVRYFDYDKSLEFMGRDFYSLSDWQTIIYNNIKNVGPVFYAGQSAGGGHAFVCDGYDTNGYFHFNWGWSGASDGYYLLTALNPESQGIGGSSSTDGFNTGQRIIIGAKKNAGGDYKYSMFWSGDFQVKSANATLGSNVKVSGAYSYSVPSINGSLGVFITNSSGTQTYVAGSEFTALSIQTGYSETTIKLPSNLANGTYTVTPAFKVDGKDAQPVLLGVNSVKSYTMTVSGNTATFSPNAISSSVTISDVASEAPHMYAGKRLIISATATNTGEHEFYRTIQGALYKSSSATSGQTADYLGDQVLIDVEPGQSEQIEYISSFAAPKGNYTFVFINPDTKAWLSSPMAVTLEEAPTNSTLAASDFKVSGTFISDEGRPTLNDVSNLMFNFDLTCEAGYFDEALTICIIRGEDAASTGTWVASDWTPAILLYEGETKDVTAFCGISRPRENNYYSCYLVKGTVNYNHEVLAGPVCFYYSSTAGIDGVEADSPVVNEVLYNLQGIQVPASQAKAGHYIKVATHADGTTTTTRVVK